MSGPQKLPKGKSEMARQDSEDAQLARDQQVGNDRRAEAEKPADKPDTRGRQGWH